MTHGGKLFVRALLRIQVSWKRQHLLLMASTQVVEFTLRWPAWVTCPPLNQLVISCSVWPHLSHVLISLCSRVKAHPSTCTDFSTEVYQLAPSQQVSTIWPLPEFLHVLMLSSSQSLLVCFTDHLKYYTMVCFVFIWLLFFLRRNIPVTSWRLVKCLFLVGGPNCA